MCRVGGLEEVDEEEEKSDIEEGSEEEHFPSTAVRYCVRLVGVDSSKNKGTNELSDLKQSDILLPPDSLEFQWYFALFLQIGSIAHDTKVVIHNEVNKGIKHQSHCTKSNVRASPSPDDEWNYCVMIELQKRDWFVAQSKNHGIQIFIKLTYVIYIDPETNRLSKLSTRSAETIIQRRASLPHREEGTDNHHQRDC